MDRCHAHPAPWIPEGVDLDLPGEPAAEARLSSGLFSYCLTRAAWAVHPCDGTAELLSLLRCRAAPDTIPLHVPHCPVEALGGEWATATRSDDDGTRLEDTLIGKEKIGVHRATDPVFPVGKFTNQLLLVNHGL